MTACAQRPRFPDDALAALDQQQLDALLASHSYLRPSQHRSSGGWRTFALDQIRPPNDSGRTAHPHPRTRTIQFMLTIPAELAATTATLEVRGGATSTDDDSATDTEPASFAELLDSLATATRDDELLAELRPDDDTTEPPPASTTRRAGDVASGAITVPIDIQAPRSSS